MLNINISINIIVIFFSDLSFVLWTNLRPSHIYTGPIFFFSMFPYLDEMYQGKQEINLCEVLSLLQIQRALYSQKLNISS